MTFPIVIKVIENKPPDLTVREWRSIRRNTYEAIGRYWYANILPDHFKLNAASIYGYRKRRDDYEEKKQQALTTGQKISGKDVSPLAVTMSLTLSGLLYKAMTARGFIVRAFPSRFTVKMPGLPYTPARQRTAKQPHLQGELTKLLKREIDVLQKVGKKEGLRQIALVKGRKEHTFK